MNSYYQALRVFAVVLLCALLQNCTRDIPTPVPAPKNTKQASSSISKYAASDAREGIVAQQETIKVASQNNTNGLADSTTTALIAVCYDYFMVYYTNGVETGRDFCTPNVAAV